jgi:putative spermidine/putrescine transport system permease protein
MTKKQKRDHGSRAVVAVLFIYLILPFVITGLYSVATSWSNTLFPVGYTLKHYADMFGSSRFWLAAGRSVGVSTAAVAVAVVVMTPLTYAVAAFSPKLERLMKGLTLMPFAIPGVINATALLSTYGGGDIPMILILTGAYFVMVLPLIYSGIGNALHAIDIVPITEAARTLGASTWTTFFRIIVPGIAPGILVSTLLSFSTLFGEFVVANLLVGGSFETVQIYLYLVMKQTGHLSSALVLIYVFILAVISAILMKVTGDEKETKAI